MLGKFEVRMKKIVGNRSWLVLFSFLLTLAVQAQTTGNQKPSLETLEKEVTEYFRDQYKRAEAYARQHNIPMSYRDQQGNYVVLVGVAEDGTPMFETTDNAGAAITTGVDKVRTGGGLGLNLEGEGMRIAIWDGGIIDDHIEFGSRILLREGSTLDNHATHVTGTVLAAGVNAQAKGMAPKAEAYVYDFSNDTPEMIAAASPQQGGIILSNHSYGLIVGWRFSGGWQWNGNSSISSLEDWRFGFYSTAAAQWDQLAFSAPNYLIVKSAGNDRSDSGNGSFPPDCNGGSGYDCVSDKSVAKNILTVGAVNKVPNYVDASSVVMSSFSSWGPTDDGRIKPDLVAAGVNIFSTIASDTDDAYGSLNGTSMSSPNAAGSLLLLQELYRNLNSGQYMRSATLKALAIHSVKEAGPYPGPDYMFGWGLLDVGAGARLLLNQDNQNIYVKEETLRNGETYELILQPKANTKITATLVWTDPAGTPVGASLDPTNLMLVNDLDMRIADDAGNTQFPWILSPDELSAPAARGDNFRDNVEKIEFDNPEPRSYKITIRHKGSLRNDAQDFSLVVEYTSINDPRTAYYWIGNDGVWSNPANWSLTSGGPSAGNVPGEDDRVIVDENSFNSTNRVITLTADAACYSLTWLTKSLSGLTMNGNTLTINGPLNISSSAFSIIDNGVLRFESTTSEELALNLGLGNLTNASLVFDAPAASWRLLSQASVGSVDLVEGTLHIENQQLEVREIQSVSGKTRSLNLSGSVISGLEKFSLDNTGIALTSGDARLLGSTDNPVVLLMSSTAFDGAVELNGTGTISSTGTIRSLKVTGEVNLQGAASFEEVRIETGSRIRIREGETITFGQLTTINSSAANKTKIESTGTTEKATLNFNGHYKLCFDNLEITRVNMNGSAVINAGLNSAVVDAANWLKENCDDVLFPDFEVRFPCENGFTQFIDKSSGSVTAWSWNFGSGGNGNNTSTLQNSFYSFPAAGAYTVTLEVRNATASRQYSQSVEIAANPMQANSIILNGLNLFSERSATSYEWYRDNQPIANSNVRQYNFNGQPGAYFVVTRENGCSRVTAPFVITSIGEDVVLREPFDSGINVYPNPASERLIIEIPAAMQGVSVKIINPRGTTVLSTELTEEANQLDVSGWPSGLYLLNFRNQQNNVTRKIIIR